MNLMTKRITTALTATACACSVFAASLQDVDFSKIQTWIGDKDASLKAAAVITWNDGNGLDNLVVGFRFNEGETLTAEQIVTRLIESDVRFYASADKAGSLCFDNGGEGELLNSEYYRYDHRGLPDDTRKWKFRNFNGLVDKAVFGISFTDGEPADPDYLFYLPAADEAGLWLLDGQKGALSDNALTLPVYFNVCGGTLYSSYNSNSVLVAGITTKITRDGKTTGCTRRVRGLAWPDVEKAVRGRSIVNLNFGTAALSKTGTVESERLGDVLIQTQFAYIPKGKKVSEKCKQSAGTTFIVDAPEVPVTGISMDSVTLPMGRMTPCRVKIIPENATYLGPLSVPSSIKKGNTTYGSAKANGHAVEITTRTTAADSLSLVVSAKDYPDIKCDFNFSIRLLNPVTNITVPVDDDGYIHLPAYMKSEYMINARPSHAVIEPTNADVPTLKLVITEGPGAKAGETPLVTNYLQKGDNSNDLSSRAFADVAALDKYSADVAADPSRILTCTAHYEATDGSGVRSNDFKVIVDPRDRTPLADQYQDGTFWLNEDWFGHANGSVNYITPEREVKYRVYESQNPDQAFGCTAQYGMIYGDRLYVMSKQNHDTGDRDR